MLNQTRTILLNRPAQYFSGVTGSEYIPPEFSTIGLDTEMTRIHEVLFPRGVDKFTENYIASLLLHILHTPELLDYTLYPDARITYDLSQDAMGRMTNAPVVMVSSLVGSNVVPGYRLVADKYPQDLRYAGEHTWICTKVGATYVKVVHNGVTEETANIASGTRSKLLEFLPGYLYAYFDMPSQQLTGLVQVTYTTKVAPPYNIATKLGELLQVAYQGSALTTLFSPTAGYTTQLSELKDVLNNSPEITLRFGSLVLAFVYHCASLSKVS